MLLVSVPVWMPPIDRSELVEGQRKHMDASAARIHSEQSTNLQIGRHLLQCGNQWRCHDGGVQIVRANLSRQAAT